MSALIKMLLSMSLAGTLLAALLLALRPLLRRRTTRTFQYALWLLVVLRLLTPVTLGLGVLPQAMERLPAAAEVAVTAPLPAEAFAAGTRPLSASTADGPVVGPLYLSAGPRAVETPGPEAGTAAESGPAAAPAPTDHDPARSPLSAAKAALKDGRLLNALWAAGALTALLRLALDYRRFSRALRAGARPASPEERALLAALTRRPPALLHSPACAAPMLAGLLRPVIWLPERDYGPARLEHILRHELTHRRRGDLHLKWLTAAAGVVHWFNPLLPLLRREIDRAGELACDEAVIDALTPAQRLDYGETLLAVAAGPRLPAGAVRTALCGEKRALRARMEAIGGHRARTRSMALLAAAALVLVLACAALLGVFSPAPAAEAWGAADLSRGVRASPLGPLLLRAEAPVLPRGTEEVTVTWSDAYPTSGDLPRLTGPYTLQVLLDDQWYDVARGAEPTPGETRAVTLTGPLIETVSLAPWVPLPDGVYRLLRPCTHSRTGDEEFYAAGAFSLGLAAEAETVPAWMSALCANADRGDPLQVRALDRLGSWMLENGGRFAAGPLEERYERAQLTVLGEAPLYRLSFYRRDGQGLWLEEGCTVVGVEGVIEEYPTQLCEEFGGLSSLCNGDYLNGGYALMLDRRWSGTRLRFFTPAGQTVLLEYPQQTEVTVLKEAPLTLLVGGRSYVLDPAAPALTALSEPSSGLSTGPAVLPDYTVEPAAWEGFSLLPGSEEPCPTCGQIHPAAGLRLAGGSVLLAAERGASFTLQQDPLDYFSRRRLMTRVWAPPHEAYRQIDCAWIDADSGVMTPIWSVRSDEYGDNADTRALSALLEARPALRAALLADSADTLMWYAMAALKDGGWTSAAYPAEAVDRLLAEQFPGAECFVRGGGIYALYDEESDTLIPTARRPSSDYWYDVVSVTAGADGSYDARVLVWCNTTATRRFPLRELRLTYTVADGVYRWLRVEDAGS